MVLNSTVSCNSLIIQFLRALVAKAVSDCLGDAFHIQPPHDVGPLAGRRRRDDRRRASQTSKFLLALLVVVRPPQRAAEDGPGFLGHDLKVNKVGIR